MTGRIVPEDVILSTLRKLPESIRILSPLVDFLATFENEENEPRLVYTCKHEDKVENSDDGEICQIYNGNYRHIIKYLHYYLCSYYYINRFR